MMFLFGLIKIPMYSFYWVYTSAQLDLLAYDTPIVVYDKVKTGEETHSKKEMDELTRRWMEKKRKQESEGKEFNFKDFINAPVSNLGGTQN